LIECTDANVIRTGTTDRGRVERGSAIAAERLNTTGPARRDLDELPGFSSREFELTGRRTGRDAKRSATEPLAIGAIADARLSRINLSLEFDPSAIAGAGDPHSLPFPLLHRPWVLTLFARFLRLRPRKNDLC